jgi:hypothetical protein
MAAVTPAPVAAETAAMIAMVAFDILKEGATFPRFRGSIYLEMGIRREKMGVISRERHRRA